MGQMTRSGHQLGGRRNGISGVLTQSHPRSVVSRAGLALLLMCSVIASVLTVAATSLPAGAVPATPQTYFSSPLDNDAAMAFDSAGNLYLGSLNGNSITVLPKASGTIFGQSVTAGRAVTLAKGPGINDPLDLIFDSAGDLFIANAGNNTISVLPRRAAFSLVSI